MRSRTRIRSNRAFTLIEILIVVVILGILAAIVIPQFTNASQDAQNSQVRSQLQTVRGQLELYNVQNGAYPASVIAGTDWSNMTGEGYLQQDPRNALRSNATGIVIGALAPDPDGAAVDSTGGADDGWYFNTTTNILYGIDNEGNLIDF